MPHGTKLSLWKALTEKPVITAIWSLGAAALVLLFLNTASIPLIGSHTWRQADTLFTGYFFCNEDANILAPRVAQRGDTTGIAIGEFPLYSWLISIPCQITGLWSEAWPKAFSLSLFLIGSILWGLALSRRYKREFGPMELAILLLGSETFITFWPVPLPDSLALFLFGLAGYFWASYSRFWSFRNFLALGAVTLGFLIRPYLVPLVAVLVPLFSMRMIIALIFIRTAYGWWFIDMVKNSTFAYYYVHPKPLADVLSELPNTFQPFLKLTMKDHLNYVLMPFFVMGLAKSPFLGALWIGAAGLVIGMSGQHFLTHAYYMLAAGMLALIIAARGLPHSRSLRMVVLLAYVVIGVANTQHLFHSPKDRDWAETPTLVDQVAPYKTKIVTLNPTADHIPIWLYYAKRTGWSWIDTPENRARACQVGAAAYLIKDSSGLHAIKCE